MNPKTGIPINPFLFFHVKYIVCLEVCSLIYSSIFAAYLLYHPDKSKLNKKFLVIQHLAAGLSSYLACSQALPHTGLLLPTHQALTSEAFACPSVWKAFS